MDWRPLQRRCGGAVGAVWLTRRSNEGWFRRAGMAAEVGAARKRAGIVVGEASEAGLASRRPGRAGNQARFAGAGSLRKSMR